MILPFTRVTLFGDSPDIEESTGWEYGSLLIGYTGLLERTSFSLTQTQIRRRKPEKLHTLGSRLNAWASKAPVTLHTLERFPLHSTRHSHACNSKT